MPKFIFDPNATNALSELLPDGDYYYEVLSACITMSNGEKTKNSDQIEMKMGFYSDASFATKRGQWTETLIFHPSCDWKVSLFCRSANFLINGQTPPPGEIDLNDKNAIGLRGVATVRSKPGYTDKERKFNYVAAWLTKEKLPRAVQPVKGPDDDVPF